MAVRTGLDSIFTLRLSLAPLHARGARGRPPQTGDSYRVARINQAAATLRTTFGRGRGQGTVG